ncbi:hypothetical protein OQA88_3001 [Cercophora sp. LCS_1]
MTIYHVFAGITSTHHRSLRRSYVPTHGIEPHLDLPTVVVTKHLTAGSTLTATAEPRAIPGFGAITEKNGKLFIAEQQLFTADRRTGSYTRLSTSDCKGSTSMGYLGNTLFVVQAGSLHAVNPIDGAYKILGKRDAWTGHTSMAVSGSELFIIRDEKLWKVDPATGQYNQLGSGRWISPAYLAAAGNSGKLLAIENSHFYVVDEATGQYTAKGGQAWKLTTAFAAADESVAFAIEADGLWRTNANDGSYAKLSDGWAGRSVMVAMKGVTC